MKTILLLISISVIITSCSNKKDYKYIETVIEKSNEGIIDTVKKESIVFEALNDSLAYIQAIKIFRISIRANKKTVESMNELISFPIDFNVYCEKHHNITKTTIISSKDSLKKSKLIFNANNYLSQFDSLNIVKKIDQLEREIKSINKGIDFSTYRGTVDALQMEIILFGTWADIIMEGENSDDYKLKKLSKKLKIKVTRLQSKEFPILRKEYAKIFGKKMWENDIVISANGNGRKIINFTGGLFAANKNIKDFQTQLNEVLTIFRFKKSHYRWYKGANEYTYYTIYEGKDTDLVTF